MTTGADKTAFRAAVERLRADIARAEDARLQLFRAVAARLRKRTLEVFRRDEWPKLRLLDEVLQKRLGLPVPTLSVCGHGTAEVRFTRLLAYFFDHRQPHGLGGLLAEAVFGPELADGPQIPFRECVAAAEFALGRGRRGGRDQDNYIDLRLTVGEHEILVEQKILSSEGQDQLAGYAATARELLRDRHLHFFFLTPAGREGRDRGWTPLSHGTLFSRMGAILECHALSPTARHNLRGLLWDLMVGPVAQDEAWLTDLRRHVHTVAGDCRHFLDIARWFERHGMEADERRVFLRTVEV